MSDVEPNAEPAPKPLIPPPPTTAKTFTQEEVNDLMGKARGEGRSSFNKEISELFGGKTVEEVAALATEYEKLVDSQKSEQQRALEAAATAQAEAQAAKQEAETNALESKLTVALFKGSDETPALNPARLEAALMMGVPYALANGGDIDTAISFIRSSSPEWFAPSSPGEPKTVTPPAPARGPGVTAAPIDDVKAKVARWADQFASKQGSPVPGPRP